ncbi:MAG: hypothetical protein R2716_12955 [Microthrixaceae bacterium]
MPSPVTATSSCSRLPPDLLEAVDALLPPRWSRNNPVDLAGGETRDTIPEVLELSPRTPRWMRSSTSDSDQANQARMMREGGYYGEEGHDDHGIQRIVAFHERQGATQRLRRRYRRTAKPI